jgi:hypothetical protein
VQSWFPRSRPSHCSLAWFMAPSPQVTPAADELTVVEDAEVVDVEDPVVLEEEAPLVIEPVVLIVAPDELGLPEELEACEPLVDELPPVPNRSLVSAEQPTPESTTKAPSMAALGRALRPARRKVEDIPKIIAW